MYSNPFSDNINGLHYCSLGSGSKGNATLVVCGKTVIMIDCGFSLKETLKRLALKGVAAEDLSAILVTHEHSDHIAGVARLSNRYSIPVWVSKGTSLHKASQKVENIKVFNSHSTFVIDQINIQPIPVPHDAREATQFIFSADGHTLGLLTDVGLITPYIVERYASCNALMLEFNYDHQMLMQGSYPYGLKQRVSGDLGHLSNQQAIDFLHQLDCTGLTRLNIMHISQQNNSVKMVKDLLASQLYLKDVAIQFADQEQGFEWVKMGR